MRKLLALVLTSLMISANANVAVQQINTIISKSQQRNVVKDRFKDYYFIYIFKSTCPHCKKFSPVIHDFTETFEIPVKAYSVDGGTAQALKSSLITPDIFNSLFTSAGYKPVVPALFLVNKVTHQAYAVTFGEASAVDLAARLDELMPKIKERYDA